MMYRSGWASKEGQNRILAIDIERTGHMVGMVLENFLSLSSICTKSDLS
ncbi:DUF4291 family protein [Pseudobacteroides cellulosolvens]|nr:DUF4291 family protein [Pseudobacteroides cellulosolvens]